MKNYHSTILAVTASILCIGALTACGQGDDGIKPEVKAEVSDVGTIARKAGGDYSKLSDADKQKVLKMAGGNEATAKMLVNQMAHPPSEMNAGKTRGGAPSAPN